MEPDIWYPGNPPHPREIIIHHYVFLQIDHQLLPLYSQCGTMHMFIS
jgi:hypothetical protein